MCCTLTLALCSILLSTGPTRIGIVEIRDYSGKALDIAAVDRQLAARLRAAGYETVDLKRDSPASVEEAARQAGAQYVLYMEVLDVRPARVEVEFRLYGLDETFPRVSASAETRGRKVQAVRPLPPGIALSLLPTEPEASAKNPLDQALDAVFDKQIRMIGAGIRRGPVQPSF